MSTTYGKITSAGQADNDLEVYLGVNYICLFAQHELDRDGKGTKILLDEDNWKELIDMLEQAGNAKGWKKIGE